MKLITRISPILLTLLLGLLLLWLWYPLRQTLPFGDEAEHVILGWHWFEFGTPLYSVLSTNHQPIPIMIGGALSHLIQFEVLFDFISRLRLAMWAWWLMWGLWISFRFRTTGFIAWAIVFTSSPLLLGFHVLAESLVAPVIVYLIFHLNQLMKQSSRTVGLVPISALALLSVFIGMSHASSWLFLLAVFVWSLIRFKTKIILPTLVSGILALRLMGSPIDWYRETISHVTKYFLPYSHGSDTLGTWITKGLYPFLSLFHLNEPLGLMVGVLCVVVLIENLKKPSFNKWLLFGLVLLLNTRLDRFDLVYYGGFHLLPQLAGLAALASLSLPRAPWHKSIVGTLIIVLVSQWQVWIPSDRTTSIHDYMIGYGDAEAYGKVIKVLAQPEDTLLAGEFAGYMTVVAGIRLYANQHALLPWSFEAPTLSQRFTESLTQSLPEFVYFDTDINPYLQSWQAHADDHYLQLRRSDGAVTRLFVHQRVFDRANDFTLTKLQEEAFLLPSRNLGTGRLEYQQ